MKVTVQLPDELCRRAKAEAALRGCTLKHLVEEGLRLVLDAPRTQRRKSNLARLTRRARGVMHSEVPDLGSNPGHLAGFGRDDRRYVDTEPLLGIDLGSG
jgi:hypothetical protein